MKRIAILLAVLIGLVLVGSMFGVREEATPPTPPVSELTQPAETVEAEQDAGPTAAQKSFIHYLLKSGEEPTVKDATWATVNNLYVGVISDGTSRDGFAEYICSVAADQGIRPELVKIIDVVALKRTGKFEEQGKAYCRMEE